MELTPEEKAMFEWQYRMMGDFRTALMKTICLADVNNLAKLESSFPDEVNGYRKYSQESGWWKKVQNKAVKMGWIKHAD